MHYINLLKQLNKLNMNINNDLPYRFSLNPDLRGIDWQRVVALFEQVNWRTRQLEDINSAFTLSSNTLFVYEDEILIGFGRTISDGRYYALLADIVVCPAYQGQGIGKRLVNELNGQLAGYHFVTLSAAPGADKFYQGLGWKKQKTAFIFPQGPKQLRQHCERD